MTPHSWKGIEALPILVEAGVSEKRGVVRVPYRLPDGSEHNAKLFAPGGRCWWEEPGLGLLPLGLETLPDREAAAECALLVAEGESDALALRQGFAQVVGDGVPVAYHVLGLPGAGTWRREWRRYVAPFPLVYLLGDGDASGRRMIEALHRDVPWSRPVWLPEGEDARSILQRHGPRSLDALLDRADEIALLCYAFKVAKDYDEFIALLRGEEARHVA